MCYTIHITHPCIAVLYKLLVDDPPSAMAGSNEFQALRLGDSDVESDEEFFQEEETEEDKQMESFINAVKNG